MSSFVFTIAMIGAMSLSYTKGYDAGFNQATKEALVTHTEELELMFIESEDLEKKFNKIDMFYTSQQVELRKEISRLKKEVILYEQKNRNRCLVLDHDWVLMHDEAARLSGKTNKPAASLDDDTARAINDNNKLSVIVNNYSSCALYIKQLKALQEYIKASSTQ